jgi:hypothetical protein
VKRGFEQDRRLCSQRGAIGGGGGISTGAAVAARVLVVRVFLSRRVGKPGDSSDEAVKGGSIAPRHTCLNRGGSLKVGHLGNMLPSLMSRKAWMLWTVRSSTSAKSTTPSNACNSTSPPPRSAPALAACLCLLERAVRSLSGSGRNDCSMLSSNVIAVTEWKGRRPAKATAGCTCTRSTAVRTCRSNS